MKINVKSKLIEKQIQDSIDLKEINDRHGRGLSWHISHDVYKTLKDAVTENDFYIKYVTNQAEELCLISVKQNGLCLSYIKKQTYKICLAAVKDNPRAFKHIKNPIMRAWFNIIWSFLT